MADSSTGTRLPERRKAETLRVRDISPTLTVDDIEKSLVWYQDIVGFHVQETWEHEGKVRGAQLVAGSEGIMLSQDDWAKGRDRQKGVGLSLYLSTAQDVDEIAENIRARGGKLESEPEDMPWGPRAFSLIDPDGFRLVIVAQE